MEERAGQRTAAERPRGSEGSKGKGEVDRQA
jgi:hypothetical protein